MGSKAPQPIPKHLKGKPQPASPPPPPKRVYHSFLEGAKFVPDSQGGHIVFNGKVWRPTHQEATTQNDT